MEFEIPNTIAGIPLQYQIYAVVAAQVLKYGAELYSSVRAGGGLRRIIMAFWFGEQLPKCVAEDYKKELSNPPFKAPTP